MRARNSRDAERVAEKVASELSDDPPQWGSTSSPRASSRRPACLCFRLFDITRFAYATFIRTAMIARKVAAHSPECERLVTSRGLS